MSTRHSSLRRKSRLALCCLAMACGGPPGAGLLRGEDLGTFEIDVNELSNTCGNGALGSSPQWQFSVDLSASSTELFWGGRASSRLRDTEFYFSLIVPVSVASADSSRDEKCTVARTDVISGVLEGDLTAAVSLSGELQYQYAPTPNSVCGANAAAASGLAQLPCTMHYAMTGTRVRTPE